MPSIHVRNLFDEQHEIMAWITLLGAGLGVAFDRLEDWPGVALIGLALVTMLGSARYKGVKVGPGGVDVE